MIFNKILTTWRYSFFQFKWSELKVSLLLSLKTFIGSLKLLGRYFWWVFLLIVLVEIYCNTILVSPTGLTLRIISHDFLSKAFVLIFLRVVFGFIMYLSIRPSLERKDIYYFLNYFRIFPAYLLIAALLIGILLLDRVLSSYLDNSMWKLKGLLELLLFFFGISIPLSNFFYLDSRGTIKSVFKSIWNGLKSIIYFFPVFFTLTIIEYFIVRIYGKFLLIPEAPCLYNNILGHLSMMILLIVNIFFLSVISVHYIKFKHSHQKLFGK